MSYQRNLSVSEDSSLCYRKENLYEQYISGIPAFGRNQADMGDVQRN